MVYTVQGYGVRDGFRHDAALQHRQRPAPAVPHRRHQLRRRRGARGPAWVPERFANCSDGIGSTRPHCQRMIRCGGAHRVLCWRQTVRVRVKVRVRKCQRYSRVRLKDRVNIAGEGPLHGEEVMDGAQQRSAGNLQQYALADQVTGRRGRRVQISPATSTMGAMLGRESTTRKVRFARCCRPSARSTTAYNAATCRTAA